MKKLQFLTIIILAFISTSIAQNTKWSFVEINQEKRNIDFLGHWNNNIYLHNKYESEIISIADNNGGPTKEHSITKKTEVDYYRYPTFFKDHIRLYHFKMYGDCGVQLYKTNPNNGSIIEERMHISDPNHKSIYKARLLYSADNRYSLFYFKGERKDDQSSYVLMLVDENLDIVFKTENSTLRDDALINVGDEGSIYILLDGRIITYDAQDQFNKREQNFEPVIDDPEITGGKIRNIRFTSDPNGDMLIVGYFVPSTIDKKGKTQYVYDFDEIATHLIYTRINGKTKDVTINRLIPIGNLPNILTSYPSGIRYRLLFKPDGSFYFLQQAHDKKHTAFNLKQSYYGDINIYNFSLDGEMVENTTIKKKQFFYEKGMGGPNGFGDYFAELIGEDLVIIYNDHEHNFNGKETKDLTDPDDMECIIVKINCKTGNTKKDIFCSRSEAEENNMRLMPGYFELLPDENKILLWGAEEIIKYHKYIGRSVMIYSIPE